jgi:hypothetical protein
MLTKTAEMMKVLKMITGERMSALPTSKARHGAGKGSGKLTIGGTGCYVLSPASFKPLVRLARARFSLIFRSYSDEFAVAVDLDLHGANPHLVLSHLSRREPAEPRSYEIAMARTYPHLGGGSSARRPGGGSPSSICRWAETVSFPAKPTVLFKTQDR